MKSGTIPVYLMCACHCSGFGPLQKAQQDLLNTHNHMLMMCECNVVLCIFHNFNKNGFKNVKKPSRCQNIINDSY